MAFKHGLLEGSTFLFQYSSMIREPFESCELGELKYAIPPGSDIRLKNKSVRKCKKMTLRDECTWSLYCAYVLTSLDKSKQAWSTIFPQPWVPRSSNFAHPQTCVQFPNRTSLETLRPSGVVESALRHASVGVRCELVWSATFLQRTTTSEISLESSWLGESKCEVSPGYDLIQKSYGFR